MPARREGQTVGNDATHARVQYIGVPGVTQECIDAVAQVVQTDPAISSARIITTETGSSKIHCLLLRTTIGERIFVPSGFASGYGGEGPNGLSYTLALLRSLGIETDEVEVPRDIVDRIDNSCLLEEDVDQLEEMISFHAGLDYINPHHYEAMRNGTLWGLKLYPFIPLGSVEPDLADIAISFWDSPATKLMAAFRRLEDKTRSIVAQAIGEEALELTGAKLFSRAFLTEPPVLTWEGVPKTERTGRANLFTASYMAYRNARAHRESTGDEPAELLQEFLLVNLLFSLLRKAALR